MNRCIFLRVAAGAAALGGAAFGVEAGYVEPRSLEFTRGRIPGTGTATLRLAHISDLHLRYLTEQHRRIADGIIAEVPHLLLAHSTARVVGRPVPSQVRLRSAMAGVERRQALDQAGDVFAGQSHGRT